MLLNTLDELIETTPIATAVQRQQFATLRGEAARINNALIYLLGLYRLQEHQLPLQIKEVQVTDFLEEQIDANELLFSIRQLAVRCECDDQLTAYFDPARDDGEGFPEKMLHTQHNHERGIDFTSGSTNLGLYFAAEVAHLHRRGETRGSIELSNQQPHGSCFRLLLP
jgi:signal transduction histidine kinase